jgi:hypothetical protein
MKDLGEISQADQPLTAGELEVALKALSFYQIRLFDQQSGGDQTEMLTATRCIKKLHAMHEKIKNKES